MKRSNKIVSLLLVTFIVGVNALTGCGSYPILQATDPEKSVNNELVYSSDEKKENVQPVLLSQMATGKNAAATDITKGKAAAAVRSERIKENPNQAKENTKQEQKADEPVSEICTAPEITEEPNYDFITQDTSFHSAPAVFNPIPENQNTAEPLMPVTECANADKTENCDILSPEEQGHHILQSEVEIIPADIQEIKDTIQAPIHVHSYEATIIEPSCTSEGYTIYKCECGESYTADHSSALGHNWVEQTESTRVGQEAHEICGDCGMDLTASGITGSAIAEHAKNHVLSDDNATGRTYTVAVEVYQEKSTCFCSRCGCEG